MTEKKVKKEKAKTSICWQEKGLMEQMIEIQDELDVPKGQRNTFGGYNYRSCEDIFEEVKPKLKERGLLLYVQDTLVKLGDRYYIKAIAKITDGKDFLTGVAYAREELEKKGMDGSQITGASSSYARKYALNGLFLIDDVKDSDATNKHDKDKKSPKSPAEKKFENELKETQYEHIPCSKCGVELSPQEVKWCESKTELYKAEVYCKTCQKDFVK